MTTLKIAAATAVILLSTTIADAKRCDGFNGCRCGVVQASHFGLPLNYNGINLKQASQWKRLPHTSLRVGVVMYRHGLGPTGHVSRVVAVHGGCDITVVDERGEHRDSACGRGNVFVDPHGNVAQQFAYQPQQTEHYSARRHSRRAKYIQMNFQPEDRLSVH